MLGRKIGWAVLLVAVVFVLQVALDFWVKMRIDQCLEITVEGRFMPLPFHTAFRISGVRFAWDDKVRILSGNLKVQYPILGVFRAEGIRVKVHGDELEAEFLGDWVNVNQGKTVKFKTIDIDVSLNPQGIQEVYQLSADSPNLKMSLRESSRSSRIKG